MYISETVLPASDDSSTCAGYHGSRKLLKPLRIDILLEAFLRRRNADSETPLGSDVCCVWEI